MVSIGIGVMGHQSRMQQWGELYGAVRANEGSVDDGSYGENANGDRVWKHLAEHDTDWSIVLQDDALPVPDFRQHAEAALSVAGDSLVSFYVGTLRPRDPQVTRAVELAEATDASWLVCDALLWGVGVAMPTNMIEGFLSWAGTQMPGTDELYDRRLGMWANRVGLQVKYTWPSLVDHADGFSLASDYRGVPQPRGPRVARKLGSRAAYDGPTVRIPRRGEVLPPKPLSQSL